MKNSASRHGFSSEAGYLHSDIYAIPQTKLDTMPSHISPPQLPLAGKVVRFQGEPVAVIAADTLLQAEDAAAAIHVEYDHLPVVSGISRWHQRVFWVPNRLTRGSEKIGQQ